MDDRQRLLRLVSLVAWAGEPGSNSCGLRFTSEKKRQQWYGTDESWVAAHEQGGAAPPPEGVTIRAKLWRLTSWYTGAVWTGNDPTSGDIDTRQLPAVALAALEGLPEDTLAILGRMVLNSLGIGFDVDEIGAAHRWAEDVKATAWRLLIAEHEDIFGRHH